MFYFRLNRIYDDGQMDIHTEQMGPDYQMEPDARNLGDGLYDLPSGNCIWHGYIVADGKEEAHRLVAAAYNIAPMGRRERTMIQIEVFLNEDNTLPPGAPGIPEDAAFSVEDDGRGVWYWEEESDAPPQPA